MRERQNFFLTNYKIKTEERQTDSVVVSLEKNLCQNGHKIKEKKGSKKY